tara:strand:+ start:73294 stop:75051 length:1758 start_codon:yes stop_codon:yes gene_type:complete
MARIETYPLDYNISVNDYVIGTDGDSLNATKNYKVLTFLDYLGTMYNLNSTDLLFNYNNVAAGSVANGQVSTNNFADPTILMSGVTNIYVSKVTAFAQLVDDIINTTGTEGLTIMFTDMGNRNNLGIFTVVSTADVDANTINMTVTASTAVGSIDAGKVMGIRIGVGGGGGVSSWLSLTDTPSTYAGEAFKIPVVNVGETALELTDDYVTQTTQQLDISGFKLFTSGGTNALSMSGGFAHGMSVGNSAAATNGYIQFLTAQGGNFDTSWNPNSFQGTEHQYRIGISQGDWILQGGGDGTSIIVPYTRLDQSAYTGARTQTWQDKDGTIAHLADIPTLTDPYRSRVSSTVSAPTVSYNVLTFGNIETTTATEATIAVSFTSESSITGYPILIRLRSTRVGGTTYTFTTGILDKNGNDTFSVFVPQSGERSIHFVVADSGSTVATNYPPILESEGSFTATLSDVGGGATYTIGSQICNYYRVGKLVSFALRLSSISTSGTASGTLTIGGLPFNMNTGIQNIFPVNMQGASGVTWYSINAFGRNATGKELSFKIQSTLDANHDSTFVTGMSFTGGAINITGSYFTNDA